MGPIQHIVVGVDGSKVSAHALGWAADVAHATNAQVTVVHAADLVERYRAHASSEDAFEDALRDEADRDWCAPLRQHGVLYEVVIRPGNPADVLLDVAANRGGDLVVVGRRGHDRPDVGSLGSTSLQAVAESTLPVVVISATPDF